MRNCDFICLAKTNQDTPTSQKEKAKPTKDSELLKVKEVSELFKQDVIHVSQN